MCGVSKLFLIPVIVTLSGFEYIILFSFNELLSCVTSFTWKKWIP